MTDSKRHRKARKMRSEAELAPIIVFASLHGAKRAATEFDISERTITRKRGLIGKGKLPKLAELVLKADEENSRKHADKLDAAYDKALTELEAKLSGATVEELTEAVKVLADARLNRQVMLDEPVGYREAERATAAARQAPRGAGASTAVVGATGAAASDAAPVH